MTHHDVDRLRSLSPAGHFGGGGEIRTLEEREPLLVFKRSEYDYLTY